MRALWRHCLASLVIGTAALCTGGLAHAASLAATYPGGPVVMAACPAGTHWDNITHTCV